MQMKSSSAAAVASRGIKAADKIFRRQTMKEDFSKAAAAGRQAKLLSKSNDPEITMLMVFA